MKTKVLLTTAAVILVIISTVAIGSNMGFKIAIPITAGKSNFVSIPYYNSYTDAYSLALDLKGTDSVLATVNRWNPSTPPSGAVESWNSNNRGTLNFTVVPGECYWVTLSAAKAGPWIIVGSHNPTLALSVTSGVSNFVSVPYHTNATDAYGLAVQIKGVTGALVTVNRWNLASDLVESWNSNNRGTLNFSITAGEGVWVSTTSSLSWAPSHY